MLSFCKKVLDAVSFDRSLFKKELRKASERLGREEQKKLRCWGLISYGSSYRKEILEVLGPMGKER